MRTRLLAMVVVVVMSSPLLADTIVVWTFEISQPSADNTSDIGPIAAETGVGSASGHHGSSATDYSTPVGNGSAHSFSSNTWAVGDYYQFQTSSLGFEDIIVSFDQTRSATGPASFRLRYSSDGTNFSDVSYSVSFVNWSSVTSSSASNFSFDLSAVAGLENAASIYFRLSSQAASTGTNRVDNFKVEGTQIAAAVPTPTAFGGGAVLCGLLAIRRGRSFA